MLTIERVFRVRCSICKNVFTYQDEESIPEICPNCMDGKMVDSEQDALEDARMKRMYSGTGTYYKKFKV